MALTASLDTLRINGIGRLRGGRWAASVEDALAIVATFYGADEDEARVAAVQYISARKAGRYYPTQEAARA